MFITALKKLIGRNLKNVTLQDGNLTLEFVNTTAADEVYKKIESYPQNFNALSYLFRNKENQVDHIKKEKNIITIPLEKTVVFENPAEIFLASAKKFLDESTTHTMPSIEEQLQLLTKPLENCLVSYICDSSLFPLSDFEEYGININGDIKLETKTPKGGKWLKDLLTANGFKVTGNYNTIVIILEESFSSRISKKDKIIPQTYLSEDLKKLNVELKIPPFNTDGIVLKMDFQPLNVLENEYKEKIENSIFFHPKLMPKFYSGLPRI